MKINLFSFQFDNSSRSRTVVELKSGSRKWASGQESSGLILFALLELFIFFFVKQVLKNIKMRSVVQFVLLVQCLLLGVSHGLFEFPKGKFSTCKNEFS